MSVWCISWTRWTLQWTSVLYHDRTWLQACKQDWHMWRSWTSIRWGGTGFHEIARLNKETFPLSLTLQHGCLVSQQFLQIWTGHVHVLLIGGVTGVSGPRFSRLILGMLETTVAWLGRIFHGQTSAVFWQRYLCIYLLQSWWFALSLTQSKSWISWSFQHLSFRISHLLGLSPIAQPTGDIPSHRGNLGRQPRLPNFPRNWVPPLGFYGLTIWVFFWKTPLFWCILCECLCHNLEI